MSSEFHHYTREEFLGEFFPGPADKAEIAAGMEQLRAEQRAWRLADMRRRLGVTQAEVAQRMGVTQGRVSAIEHAKPGATELRTLAAYVEALGGRLEIIADFGDQRLAFTEPGHEAA
ncbi:MAG: helix-turn-helix domain-containing protein [Streptosporangiaceae bacterium]